MVTSNYVHLLVGLAAVQGSSVQSQINNGNVETIALSDSGRQPPFSARLRLAYHSPLSSKAVSTKVSERSSPVFALGFPSKEAVRSLRTELYCDIQPRPSLVKVQGSSVQSQIRIANFHVSRILETSKGPNNDIDISRLCFQPSISSRLFL
jgi:hypothetical protein